MLEGTGQLQSARHTYAIASNDDSEEVWWAACRTAFGMYRVGLEMRSVALKGGVSAPLYLPAPGGKIES
jgi:hypothetical protein